MTALVSPVMIRSIIAAHRGGAALNPENSRAAFLHAIALGAQQIETDVHLSSDDEPVLMHDATLDRTTMVTGAVRQKTWGQLQAIRLKGSEECVPHLDELLVMLSCTATDLRLEIKLNSERQRYPGMAAKILDHLQRAGMQARTTLSSFDWMSLRAFQPIAPQQRMLGLIKPQRFEQLGGLAGVCQHATGYALTEISIHVSQLESGMVSAAQDAGIRLGCYAANEAADIEKALLEGVCAFTTDRPDIALRLHHDLSA